MIISLDTETTGVDFAHGAMPFLVTTCDTEGTIRFWEWDVSPITRRPEVPPEDVADIAELLDAAETVYIQNSKFDAHALASIGIALPWPKVRDTLVASHVLATNHRHDLTALCLQYLGVDIEPHELLVKEVTRACRAIVKRDYPDWRIAAEGLPDMPSVRGGSSRDEDKPWKNDMWLPRALIKHRASSGFLAKSGLAEEPTWANACSRYANADSEHTLFLGLELETLLRARGLWWIYKHRLDLPRVAYEMESYGVTARGDYTAATVTEYEAHVAEAEAGLHAIAREYDYDLQLARGAAINDNMREFFYGSVVQRCPRCDYAKHVKHWNGEMVHRWNSGEVDESELCPKCLKGSIRRSSVRQMMGLTRKNNLALPVIPNKKTGNASLDEEAMSHYVATLDGSQQEFVRLLIDKRGYDTALSYMGAYQRFWVPVLGSPGYFRIHPSLNPCGTDHLRWASNSPNMQNVSKDDDKNLRSCFGPAPRREWWSMDFQNVELRIPAYESGEQSMIEVFERPDDSPYWGSYHNLIASIVYPEEYHEKVCSECLGKGCNSNGVYVPPKSATCQEKVGLETIREGFKKKYKATLYQWIKNFNFAKQYGCGRRKGDATARKTGAFDLVDRGLPALAKLQAHYLAQAERLGYVETLPDQGVDPKRGYPILASRTEDGRVLSTTPFNYHISGTACDVKNKALVKCSRQCAMWRSEGFDAHIPLEIHDEILFDFPRGPTGTYRDNLARAQVLQGLMASCGDSLVPRIPTPVSVEFHSETWAKGESVR